MPRATGAAKICACRVGPIPKVADEYEEEPGDLEAFLRPGDCLFAAVCSAPEATISAMRTWQQNWQRKRFAALP